VNKINVSVQTMEHTIALKRLPERHVTVTAPNQTGSFAIKML